MPNNSLTEDPPKESVVQISGIAASLPEDLFKDRVELEGDAIIGFERDGSALVIPKDETSAVIGELLDTTAELINNTNKIARSDQARAEELTALQETAMSLQRDIAAVKQEVASLSGFVKGSNTILGTGVIALILGHVFALLSKRRGEKE